MSGKKRDEIATTQATDVELGVLQGAQQGLLGTVEEVEALERITGDGLGAGQPMQVSIPGGEVVECGKIVQVAAVTADAEISRRSMRL
jgi:hypothetical protein